MAEKQQLTKEIAEQFLADDKSVDLSEFTELDDDAAESLNKYQGRLSLESVASLSDAAAESLSKHEGWLGLQLDSLPASAAEILCQYRAGPNAVGIDVGLVLHTSTTGLCRTGACGFEVTHSYTDKLSRQMDLEMPTHVDLLAVDAPVLPTGRLHYGIRPIEKIFLYKPFQRRCSVGDTRLGIGAALRRGGCDTALQFASLTIQSRCKTQYPRIQDGLHVVEAFPNAFLGVMLPDGRYPNPMPKLKRGEKFEWLLDHWRQHGCMQRLQAKLDWTEPGLWNELQTNGHHEEQAGMNCAVTAVCVLQNSYVAVGESQGGYLFLPPWDLWADWAKDGVRRNRTDQRLARQVDVWINGDRFTSTMALPT